MPRDKDKTKDQSVDKLSERLNDLNFNMYEPTSWKGKRIISVAEWEEISGLDEIRTRDKEIESRPEVMESLKITLDYPEDAWKEMASIKWEIRKEALEYFPDDVIYGVVHGSFPCPDAQGDEFNIWLREYKSLLKSQGIEESDYALPDNQSPMAKLTNGK